MTKLLHANLICLRKCKAFWLGSIISVLLIAIACFDQHRMLLKYGDEIYGNVNSDSFIIGSILYLGIITSIFCSLLIGTEYSDGVIRNKIITGSLRHNVYLANFTICAVGAATVYLLCCLSGCALALPMFGLPELTLSRLLLMLFNGILVCITYAAIYNFIAMMVPNKTHTAIICILSGILLLCISIYVLNALQQPEMIESAEIFTSDMTEPNVVLIKNPHYVTGFQRSLYEFLHDFLPTGQGIQINQRTVTHPFRLAAYSLVITLAMNLIGVYFFERKDIK